MRWSLASIVLALFTACPSQESLCKSGVDQICERQFECQPQQVKDSMQFQMAFGTTVEGCKADLYANPLRPTGATGIACKDVKDDAQLCSNLGVTATRFDLSKAMECKDARAKLECSAYLAQANPAGGGTPPAACQERCQ